MKKTQKEQFKKIKEEIKKAKRILLLTHRAPDGDAIGSMLSLGIYLKKIKKKVVIFSSASPHYLSFLPNSEKIQRKGFSVEDFDLIFALDYADAKRIDTPLNFQIDEKKVISIDHHLLSSGKKIGKIKLIDSSISSTCEILYYFFNTIGETIDKDIATCLLCGIFSDTIAFAHLKKTSQEAVVDLLRKNSNLSLISEKYFRMSFSQAKILHRVLERLEKDNKHSLVYSWVSYRDFSEIKKKFGKKESSELYLQEPPIFPDFISRINGADVYLFLVEFKKEKIKGSLRSSGKVNVAKIAEKFGGGGHKEASGFFVKGTIESALKKIKSALKKHQN